MIEVKSPVLKEEIDNALFLATDTNLEDIPEGVSYILADNGLLSVTRSRRSTVVTKIDTFGMGLEKVSPGLHWTGPRIDSATIRFVDSLFYSVWDEMGTEALVLFYLTDDDEWLVRVPGQEVSAAFVHWEDDDPDYWFHKGKPIDAPDKNALELVGTAHSHGNMGTSPSGTDDEDNKDVPGFHLIFGGYQKNVYSRVSGGGVFSDMEVTSLVNFHDDRVKMAIPDNIKRKAHTTSYSHNHSQYGIVNPVSQWSPYYGNPSSNKMVSFPERSDTRIVEYGLTDRKTDKGNTDTGEGSKSTEEEANEAFDEAFAIDLEAWDFDEPGTLIDFCDLVIGIPLSDYADGRMSELASDLKDLGVCLTKKQVKTELAHMDYLSTASYDFNQAGEVVRCYKEQFRKDIMDEIEHTGMDAVLDEIWSLGFTPTMSELDRDILLLCGNHK